MKNAIEQFLTAEEERSIISAIGEAEKNTSGEIRVHIEHCCTSNATDRAMEIFALLNMHKTAQRNAVLIYIAVEEHAFAIYGDKGINQAVSDNFWESTKDIIQDHFKKSMFAEGIIKGINHIGKQLKTYFPWTDSDKNELPDSISTS